MLSSDAIKICYPEGDLTYYIAAGCELWLVKSNIYRLQPSDIVVVDLSQLPPAGSNVLADCRGTHLIRRYYPPYLFSPYDCLVVDDNDAMVCGVITTVLRDHQGGLVVRGDPAFG